MNIDWSKSRIVNALNDCISVMERELSGLAVIQPELANAKEAMALMVKEGISGKPDWSGEGLPPVGIECETLWDSLKETYVTIFVLAHDEAGAVYRFTSGERKGEYQSEKQEQCGSLSRFRPIRTPEQIAAEERKAEIEEMARTVSEYAREASTTANVDVAIRALHQAGYRKQEQPK